MRPRPPGLRGPALLALVAFLTVLLLACASPGDDPPSATATSRTAGSNTGQLQSTAEIRSSTVVPLATAPGGSTRTSSPAGTPPLAAGVGLTPPALPANAATPPNELGWTFRYGSLVTILTGWEQTTGALAGGGTCAVAYESLFVALFLLIQNTGPEPYELWAARMALEDQFGAPVSTNPFYPNSQATGDITVSAGETKVIILCFELRAELDPTTLTLVVGEPTVEQVRVPLTPTGTARLGSYVEQPLAETLIYRDMEIAFQRLIVSTGVWSQFGSAGQAPAGQRYLLLEAHVRNGEGGYVYIDPTEIRLEIAGEVLGPSLTDHPPYQLVPGLDPGLSVTSMVAFEIPAGTTEATLRLVAPSWYTGEDREASVTLTIPSAP